MTAPRPRPSAWRWLAFFVVLGLLAAAGIAIPIVYNLSLQLTPEQVAAARARWAEHGPADYDYAAERKTTLPAEREATTEEYQVRVRGGRVVQMAVDGEPVLWAEGPAALALGGAVLVNQPRRDFEEFSIDGLFARIESALRRDAEPGGRRNYAMASFSRADGHPTHWIRRVTGSREREEWTVRLTPAR